MSWPFAFYLSSRHYGNIPTWPMLILNLFESHKLFAPFLKLTAFEPDDAFLWHQFSAGEIWFSTQTRGQIYISYSLKLKTWKSELIRIPYICCWMSLFWLTGKKLKYLLQIWKRRKNEGITKTANTRSAFEKSAGIKNPGSAALLTSLLRAGSRLLSESRRQINLFRGLKRHKFPQRANTEPSVILFCRRWMKEEIGEEGEDGWGIMRENEAVISSWYFLSHRAAGNRRPSLPPLPLSESTEERERNLVGRVGKDLVQAGAGTTNTNSESSKYKIQSDKYKTHEDKYKTQKDKYKTQKGK